MQIWDRRQSIISAAGAVIVAIVFLIVLIQLKLYSLLFLPLLFAAAFYYLNMRRYLLRRRWAKEPFPEEWRSILDRRVSYYHNLAPADRTRFETDVRVFLKENRITGVKTRVDDSLRLLVAASAVILTFGHPDWEYRKLPEILIYPRAFDEEYSVTSDSRRRSLAGQVVPQNAIVLARNELEEAFQQPGRVYHVGLHEFAHALDLVDGIAEGIPGDLDPHKLKEWYDLMQQELARVRERRSVLDPYAGKNTGELFAVAVEHFFQRPEDLKRQHPELYLALSQFFHQDPSS